MARELVLIPKMQYEHLLKQAGEELNETIQLGGQKSVQELQSSSDEVNLTENPLKADRFVQHGEESRPLDTKERPSLFVEKPLSKMKFSRKQNLTKRNKKAVKRQWINYTIK